MVFFIVYFWGTGSIFPTLWQESEASTLGEEHREPSKPVKEAPSFSTEVSDHLPVVVILQTVRATSEKQTMRKPVPSLAAGRAVSIGFVCAIVTRVHGVVNVVRDLGHLA